MNNLESKSTQSVDLSEVNDWQASKKSLKERFSVLLNNELFADVYFNVGSDKIQRFPGHKLVFSVSSVVFEKMFFGGLSENSDEIDLPDIEPPAFLAFLKFIYCDEVQLDSEIMMSAIYIAKKYNINEFKTQCLKFLEKNINNDNVLSLLIEAHHLNESKIEGWCLDFIDKHATEVLRSDDFVEIDLNTLTAIIERNTLQIAEIELYEAVVRWAAAECKRQELPLTPDNKRSVLKSAFMLIRFPLMSIEEFGGGGPTEDELLTYSEIKQLFQYFLKNPKPPTNFLNVRRSTGPGKTQTVNRFKSTSGESKWNSYAWCNCINFIVDRPVFIVGFGLYGSSTASKHDVYITLRRTDGLVFCAENDTSFTCDGSTKTWQVRFKEPFKIEPNTMYTAYVEFKDKCCTWYGLEGQHKVSINDQNGLPVNFQFSTNNTFLGTKTTVSEGQIPEIIFYT